MRFQRITARDKPETLAQREMVHEAQLKRALAIATSRAKPSSDVIRALLRSANVHGRVDGQNIKSAIISFRAEPFRGGLHQFWPWQLLKGMSDQEVASAISATLRFEVRRKLRKRGRRGPQIGALTMI
jgi:hypothetical protein